MSIYREHFGTFPSRTYIRQVTTLPSLFSLSKHFSPFPSPFFFFSVNQIFPFPNIFPLYFFVPLLLVKPKKFFFYYTDQIFSSSKYFHLFSISVLLFPCRLNVLPLLIFPSFYSPLFFFSAGQMFSFSKYILPSLFFFHSANQIFSFSKYFPYFPSSSFFSSADSLFAQKLFKYFNYCKQCQQCQQCKQYKSFIGAVLSPFVFFFTMIMPFISILETSF